MRRGIIFAAFALLYIVITIFGVGAQERDGKVDFSATVMLPVKSSDSNAYSLVGDVVFYHNGAVITCDSAVRYGERRMECFGNVIINQDSTYIYGDQVEYNGITNTAYIYSPLIKVKDGDATLYTREFSFNTLDNIGRYGGGGILRQNDTRLESDKGYYYSDTHDMVGSGSVEMQDSIYRVSSDSVRYNTDSEIAYFYRHTRVWSDEGDFLMADRGRYETKKEEYYFTQNSYILTESQEVRADSIWYSGFKEASRLQNNIQIFDRDNNTLAFGDYGTYHKYDGDRILLTKNPSVAGYEAGADTLYMRADTLLIYTITPKIVEQTETLSEAVSDDIEVAESSEIATVLDSLANEIIEPIADSVAVAEAVEPIVLTAKELREQRKAEAAEAKRVKREAAREARQAKQKAKYDLRLAKYRERNPDLVAQLMAADSLATDSLSMDTLSVDSLSVDSLVVVEQGDVQALDTATIARRLMHGYHNVRGYRADLQMVCDSLVGYSIDSTTHLFGAPVLWSGANQITSEKVIFYSKNDQLDRAFFEGAPIMASEVDSVSYNQIKGREMTAFFRDDDIYRLDVDGNGQTYYYMVEDSTAIVGFLVAESATITFTLADQQIETITYYTEPTYKIYPMDKIPETQSMLLPGFRWEEERRPALSDVFTREVLDPIREMVEAFEPPKFPIMESIDDERLRFELEGIWRDREEELSPKAIEFVESIELDM